MLPKGALVLLRCIFTIISFYFLVPGVNRSAMTTIWHAKPLNTYYMLLRGAFSVANSLIIGKIVIFLKIATFLSFQCLTFKRIDFDTFCLHSWQPWNTEKKYTLGMVQVHGKEGVKGGNFCPYPPTPFNDSITLHGLTMEVYVEWFLLIRTWYFQQTTLTNTQRVRNYGVDMRSWS